MNLKECYKFDLKKLPYDYSSLEPYIDTETMHIHHDKHLKTYVDKLNKTLESYPNLWDWSLVKLIKYNCKLPKNIQTEIRHNAGGVFNHNFYFNIMTPDAKKEPTGLLSKAIIKNFESFENFKKMFKNAALNQFGSGWAWLAVDKNKKLKIICTPNQNTPLCLNLHPILLVDVWEHAYYLKYQNKRADYLENWFNVINWEKVNLDFESYI